MRPSNLEINTGPCSTNRLAPLQPDKSNPEVSFGAVSQAARRLGQNLMEVFPGIDLGLLLAASDSTRFQLTKGGGRGGRLPRGVDDGCSGGPTEYGSEGLYEVSS